MALLGQAESAAVRARPALHSPQARAKPLPNPASSPELFLKNDAVGGKGTDLFPFTPEL